MRGMKLGTMVTKPEIRRVAVVANPLHPRAKMERAYSETVAQQLGFETSFFPTPNRGELDRALGAIDFCAVLPPSSASSIKVESDPKQQSHPLPRLPTK
jgi:hypothetical protein